jgi:hypothetical protein
MVLLLFIEESERIMNDKEKPCQQQIAKRAPRRWNRLAFPSKDGPFSQNRNQIFGTGRTSKVSGNTLSFRAAAQRFSTAMRNPTGRWRRRAPRIFPKTQEICRTGGVDRTKLEPGRRST